MRVVRAAVVTLALAVCPVAGAGCAAIGSSASTRSSTSTASGQLAQANRSHEYPTPVPRPSASRAATGPVLAIEAFATGYINWRATTVARTMRALEAISIGQARSTVALAASQTAQDYELRHGGVANSGTVEAVASVLGHADQYAVVTRERTSATNTAAYQGLPPAWHLTLATVTRLSSGGWVVSGWQPES